MLRPRRSLPARRISGLIFVGGLLLSLGAVGCGVPISDAEVSATASAMAQKAQLDASSLAAGGSSTLQSTLPVPATSTPAATAEALVSGTPSPAGTPQETPTEGPTPIPTATEPPPGSLSPAEAAAQVIQIVNNYRVSQGLKALSFNLNLQADATAYARAMGERNFFGHTGLDGSTSQSRVDSSGYGGYFEGEAIAAGQTTPQRVVDTWLNSPAHRAILLSQRAVDVGVGYFATNTGYYTFYWVFVTGSPT